MSGNERATCQSKLSLPLKYLTRKENIKLYVPTLIQFLIVTAFGELRNNYVHY